MPAFAQSPAPKAAAESEAAPLNPRYLLMTPAGRAVTEEDFRGRFQLLSFGFVSCPDVCPTTLLEYRHILRALGGDASRLQPIFVTVDPARDTPDILRAYTGAFDSRILGLTGSPELVKRAAENFRIQYEIVREPGAPADVYTMNHTAGSILLDHRGAFLARIAYGTPAADVAKRIREFMDRLGLRSAPAEGR